MRKPSVVTAGVLILAALVIITLGSIVQAEVQYSCPMHPEVKSHTPGKCPKCGMELQAAVSDHGEGANASSSHPSAEPHRKSRWGADYFPNVSLTTQYGTAVRFYDDLLKGKIVVINLIYTHCKDVCPLETARLAQVQRLLGDRVGKDIFFYSITIDPRQDTPEVLREYAEKFHAGPGWLFLTGEKKDIELVSKKLGLWSLTDADNPDGHQASLMIGNEATGQWMRNSATDNAKFLAITITNYLTGWTNRKNEPRKSYAEARPLAAPAQAPPLFAGQHLFQTRCAACHSIGQGDKIGPDLLGVTKLRDRNWLRRFIQTPDKMLAEKDPLAMALFVAYKQVQMPNLGINDADLALLIAYLESQTATVRARGKSQSKAD